MSLYYIPHIDHSSMFQTSHKLNIFGNIDIGCGFQGKEFESSYYELEILFILEIKYAISMYLYCSFWGCLEC